MFKTRVNNLAAKWRNQFGGIRLKKCSMSSLMTRFHGQADN